MNSLVRSAARPLTTPPPAPPQFDVFLAGLGVQTGLGFELRRGLASAERQTLKARGAALMPYLRTADKKEIKDCIARCFQGFSFAPTAEEAKAIAAQYILVLQDFPLWVIEQACMRFARGEVRPEEVGAKTLDLREKPTTAQLKMIAEDIAQPVSAEARRIQLVLNAPAPHQAPTAEQRARAEASIEKWRKEQGLREATATDEDREKWRWLAEEADAAHRKLVLRQYKAAGLEPPEERPGKALVSLPLLLSLGWRVETGPDRKPVLVQPPPLADPLPVKNTAAEESHQRTLRGMKQAARGVVETAGRAMEARR